MAANADRRWQEPLIYSFPLPKAQSAFKYLGDRREVDSMRRDRAKKAVAQCRFDLPFIGNQAFDRVIHRPAAIAMVLVFLLCSLSIGCSSRTGADQTDRRPILTNSDYPTSVSASPADTIPRLQIIALTNKNRLTSVVQSINLGVVRQGECILKTIVVENPMSEPITIGRFETSCDCLTLAGLPLTISAHGEAILELQLDQSNEKTFSGDLGINVNCYSDDQLVLALRADLSVASLPHQPRSL
jgi:hypothetical protein